MAGYLRRLVERATVGGAPARVVALAPARPPAIAAFDDPFDAPPVVEVATPAARPAPAIGHRVEAASPSAPRTPASAPPAPGLAAPALPRWSSSVTTMLPGAPPSAGPGVAAAPPGAPAVAAPPASTAPRSVPLPVPLPPVLAPLSVARGIVDQRDERVGEARASAAVPLVPAAIGLAAVMIGGLGNPLGPLVAGIIIGVSESLTMAIAAPAWAPLVSFSLLIAVLLARAEKI